MRKLIILVAAAALLSCSSYHCPTYNGTSRRSKWKTADCQPSKAPSGAFFIAG